MEQLLAFTIIDHNVEPARLCVVVGRPGDDACMLLADEHEELFDDATGVLDQELFDDWRIDLEVIGDGTPIKRGLLINSALEPRERPRKPARAAAR